MRRLNQKGFTLVEIIVAMALIGVIAVTFIPLMTAQYVNINRTGDKSRVTYKALEDTEEKISETEDKIKNDPTLVTKDTDPLEIKWKGKTPIKTPIKTVTGTGSTEAKGSKDSTATGTAKDSKTEIKAGVPIKE